MSKHLKIILANAPLQNGNRGCVALTISTIYLIDKILSEHSVEYTIMLADARIKSSEFDNICSVNGKKISVQPITYNAAFSNRTAFANVLKSIVKKVLLFKNRQKNYFKDADFILNIGQGDSFSDIYGKGRFHHIDLANKIAQYYHIPYCILPQTIGPYLDAGIERTAAQSLQKATMVMARDRQSYEYAKQIARKINVKEYIDIAFLLPYSVIQQPKGKIHVGLNISALLWNGGYTKNNQFGLKCDYQSLIRSIIDYFVNVPDVTLHLISHVVEPDPGIENDYEVAYNIWQEYNSEKVVLAPFALSPVDIKSYIAGLDFFMGARMHATIAAFSTGVPVVPMAYSRKFNGLFADTLQYTYIVDMKSMSDDVILSSISEAFENKRELKATIEERLSGVVKERENLLYSELKSFLKI